jgi:hypothetical protein
MESILFKFLRLVLLMHLQKRCFTNMTPTIQTLTQKPFVCMVKHNQTYVLNYDLKSLEQKNTDEGDSNELMHLKTFILNQKNTMMANIVN